jgi:Winged helix DNA-binding domain
MTGAALHDRHDIVRFRLRNQRLIGKHFARPEQAVAWHLAMQSQDFGGAKWAVGQRTANATDESVESAFARGKLLRTHVLRPTWHFVTPADVRFLLELTAPRIRAFAVPYFRKHGLDAAALKRSRRVLEKSLADGQPRTREELSRELEAASLPIRGEALSYQLIAAELDAVLISGPRRGKQHTYVAFDSRVPVTSRLERDEALGQLARRYLAAHGPGVAQDLAWWAGLTIADAKRGIDGVASELGSALIDGKLYWFLPLERDPSFESPVARLLPNYDEQLIAYKHRANAVDASVLTRASPGSAIFDGHLLLIDGLLAGGWRRELGSRDVEIEVEFARRASAVEKRAVAAEAARYAAFVGLTPKLRISLR